MNKKVIQISIVTILIGILLLLAFSCEEKFNDPYKDLDDIHLVIQCNYIEECGGALNTVAAAGADITILHYNIKTGSTDTLSIKTLDSRGMLKHQLPNSKGGISNVSFLVNYKSFVFSSYMDYLCCDSVFVLDFQRNCTDVFKSEVSCEELNQKFDIDISNQHGDCLVIGTPKEIMRNNSFSILSTDQLEIDVKPLIALNGNLTANISPAPNGQGIVKLDVNSSFFVTIFANTSVVGNFQETIELPVTCTDDESQNTQGIITVNINAEVCEDVCLCPFNTDLTNLYVVDQSNNSVKINNTKEFKDYSILRINTGMLDESCYIKVKEIKRIGSSLPINTVNHTHNWSITSEYADKRLNLHDSFNLTLSFSPTRTGEIEDKFEVITEVYNKYDELRESNCSFVIHLKGFGCEDICPIITKTNTIRAELIDASTHSLISIFYNSESITMNDGITIKQSMNGKLGTLCYGFLNDEMIGYRISLPSNQDLFLCQDIELTYSIFDDGINNDKNYFDANWSRGNTSKTSLSDRSISDDLMIKFNPPAMSSHIQAGHDSIYKCRIVITATDSYGVICSQEIKIEALVKAGNIQVSETQSMKAFSQVSDKESIPSYQAYKIDTYNQHYMYYGQVDNLKPILGHLNVQSVPPVPVTGHSFYFEVDEPQNINFRQIPKLYIIDSDFNKYNNITSVPVARYNSNIEFHNDLQDLVDLAFRPGVFTSRGIVNHNITFNISNNDVEWSPSVSASEIFASKIGIDINLGDVFIVWNTNGTTESFDAQGQNYKNFCDIAFIYIDGISDGTGTQHHIGNVSFVVAYPLKSIKF
jgi:hypothetical protein